MSQENVEVAHRMIAAFERGEWDAMSEYLDPDILARMDPRWPEQRIYGRDAFISFLRSGADTWGNGVAIEETVDLGDRLLQSMSWQTRGQRSGVEGLQRWSQIVTFRDGRYILIEFFNDHAEALKAVGLAE